MDRREFLSSSVALAIAATAGGADEKGAKDLAELLEAVHKEHKLPGIAAAVVRGDTIVAEGVAGVRRVGENDKITPNDRLALASCTKRMTSVMVARVIDSGKLAFDTTLAEALPNLPMRDDYRGVTVAQLLSHTGGIQPYLLINPMLTPIVFQLKGTPTEQRAQFVQHLLNEQPIVKPGTERKYSNAGFALVAYVASQRTGKDWQALMTEEVFQPLKMATAGFGRPRTKERPNEPALHRKTDDGYVPEVEGRMPPLPALAPAGDVHCSIRDFAKFASYEINAANGKDSLLKPETAKRWQEISRREGFGPDNDERAYFGGSQFISSGCVLWPSKNLALVVAINAGGANDAVKDVIASVKKRSAELAS